MLHSCCINDTIIRGGRACCEFGMCRHFSRTIPGLNPDFGVCHAARGLMSDISSAGVMGMVDQGEQDDKIIAVHADDPEYKHFNDTSELPKHRLREITRYAPSQLHVVLRTSHVPEHHRRDITWYVSFSVFVTVPKALTRDTTSLCPPLAEIDSVKAAPSTAAARREQVVKAFRASSCHHGCWTCHSWSHVPWNVLRVAAIPPQTRACPAAIALHEGELALLEVRCLFRIL